MEKEEDEISLKYIASLINDRFSSLGGILSYVVDNIEIIKRSNDNINMKFESIREQLNNIKNRSLDTSIMVNNITSDLDDIKSDMNCINDKIEDTNNSIKNIKIFKSVDF